MRKYFFSMLVVTLMLTANAVADTKWYVGIEAAKASNKMEIERTSNGATFKKDNDYKDLKVIVGKGTGNEYYVQGYFSKISLKNRILYPAYPSLLILEDDMSEVGIEILKKFPIAERFNPYLKFGVGAGSRKANGLSNSDSISYANFAIGVGLDLKLHKHFSILGGYDFGFRMYDKVKNSYSEFEISEKYSRVYAGANVRF